MASEQTERELLRRAKDGDFSAFQTLLVHLQPRVYSLCYHILQQKQDAEDATQQTFLAVLENIENFREEASLATWVLRIATNNSLKIIRKKRGLPMSSMSAEESEDTYSNVPHPTYIAPWTESADRILEQKETRREIENALEELNEKYRTVFVLRDIEGLSIKETADALQLSESAVKVRLLRARLTLRERLTKRFGDPEQAIVPDHNHS